MTQMKSPGLRTDQRGSVLTAALGAVLMVGVLSFSAYNLLSGPVRSASTVSMKTKAKSDQQIAARMVMNAAVDNGDGDVALEPIGPNTVPAFKPVGGGEVPASIGAPGLDPWNNAYGYCGWNHGTVNASVGGLLAGLTTDYASAVSVALISAGPNRVFDSSCVGSADGAYAASGGVVMAGDDIVEKYYYQSTAGSGGGGGGGGGSDTWEKAGSDIQYNPTAEGVYIGANSGAALLDVTGDTEIGTNLSVVPGVVVGAGPGLTTFGDGGGGAVFTLTGLLSASIITTPSLVAVAAGAGILTTPALTVSNAGATTVTNLNTQFLDDQDAAYYLLISNKTGELDDSHMPDFSGDATLNLSTGEWTVSRLQGRLIPAPIVCTYGCMMTWNSVGGVWEAKQFVDGDDVTGLHNKTVVKIQNRAVSSVAPGSNHIMGWNGTTWRPMNLDAIGDSDTIAYGGINFLGLDTNVTSGTCTYRQLVKFNGANWACATDVTVAGTLPVDIDYISPYKFERIMEAGATDKPFWSHWGVGNTIMGLEAGIGLEAMASEPSGGNNGTDNTLFGYRAGASLVGTGGNFANRTTAIGAYAVESSTGSAMSTAIGYSAARYNTSGGYVAIGNESADTNASGGGTTIGAWAGRTITGSSNTTAIGYEAGRLQGGAFQNTYIGFQAGRASTGGDVTYIGSRAGYLRTAGSHITVIGSNAAATAGTGGANANVTVIGSAAATSWTNAIQTVVIGYRAARGFVNIGGGVYIGYQAGLSDGSNYNIFIGESAGEDKNNLSFGEGNVVIGQYAAQNLTAGNFHNNTYLGKSVGQTGAGSEFNLFVGYQAGQYSKDPQLNTVVGAGAARASSGTKFGSGATPATQAQENVFIGYNAAPIISTGSLNTLIGANVGATLTTGFGNVLIGSGMDVAAGGTNDYLKIGTTRPGVGDVLYGSMVSGNMTLKGSLTSPSDVRLKRDIKPIAGALEKINRLNGVIYRWKKSFKPDDRDYMGVIAQNVKEVIPQAVFKMGDNPNSKYYTVSYDHLVPLLVEGVKEQEDKLINIEDKVEYLVQQRKAEAEKNAQ